jgi:hypothetical protein
MNIQDSQYWSEEDTIRVPTKVRKSNKRYADDEDYENKKVDYDNLFRKPQVIILI